MERRNTIQRDITLQAVRSLGKHASADEIYTYVSQEHPRIGRGTIYRNLNILAEEGKIRKLKIPDGPDCFDHNCTEHHHMRCVCCGRLFDVDLKPLPKLDDLIRDPQGMEFHDYHILFKGVCLDCRKQQEKRQ